MPTDFPQIKVAVVQAAPVLFDRAATVEKTCQLTAEAASQGAQLILFPEAFIPAYPRGLSFGTVVGSRSPQGRLTWQRYWANAVDVPGPATEALGEAAGDYHFKRDVVHKLARGDPPTEIQETVERALKATKREWEVWRYVKKHVTREGNIAIIYDLPSGSLGKAALYALGVTGADIGICTRKDKDEVDVSMRRRAGVKTDLNEMLRHITVRLGGSGGGHEGAAGASIPADLFDNFLETVKKEISPVISRDLARKR